MRKIVLFASMFFYLHFAMGQERVLATFEQQSMIENEIANSAKKMNNMICDFEQIKQSSLLSEDAVLHGKMFYRINADTSLPSVKSSASLRWEYEDGYTFIYDNDAMQVLSSDNKPLNNIKMNRFFKEIMGTMMMVINGNGMNDKSKFTATYHIDNDYWYIVLNPMQREVKNMFSLIELVFSTRDYTGERIEITEKSGDKTIITLQNKKLNTKIADEKFLIK